MTFRPLYVTEIAGLGGGETSLLNLIGSMQEGSHATVLACPSGMLAERAAAMGVTTETLPLPKIRENGRLLPTFSPKAVRQLAGLIRREQIDVVHAESLLGCYYGGLAARLTGVPCVATYHGYWQINSRIARGLVPRLVQRIYPVSASVGADLNSLFSNGNEQVQVVPLGVSPRFLTDSPEKAVRREQLGLPQNGPIVMHVARFQRIKGQHNLLEAFARMVREPGCPPHAHLVFVGGLMQPAQPVDVAYLQEVEQGVAQAGLDGRVTFLGHREDIPALMRAADVIISPSQMESFGMTIVEAMALGAPIVATKVGGPAEILTHGQTALLVPPEDPAALAKNIFRILINPQIGQALGRQARIEALRTYGPDARRDTLLASYAALLEATS